MTRRDRRTVEVRREEILAATTDLLDRIGLAAIRVSDVARALGVSPGLVFYHFGNKDALVAEAFAYAVDQDLRRLDQAVARGTDPVDRLRRVLRLYGPTGSATGWRLWIDAWALAQREPTIRAVLRRMDARWCAVLRGVVEQGVAEGAFDVRGPGRDGHPHLRAARRPVGGAAGVPLGVAHDSCGSWVAGAVARELGLDAASLCLRSSHTSQCAW